MAGLPCATSMQFWSVGAVQWHINCLELLAVLLALRRFQSVLVCHSLMTDATTHPIPSPLEPAGGEIPAHIYVATRGPSGYQAG